MRQILRIGLDIAKRWFQVHAVDEVGKEVFNRKLPRDKCCDVGLGDFGALQRPLPAVLQIASNDTVALATANLDFRLDQIVLLEKFEPLLARAGRSSGRKNIAGFKRHHAGGIGDLIFDPEDHIAGHAVLFERPIDP